MVEPLIAFARVINQRRDAYRKPALVLALALFTAGCVFSYRHLDIRLYELRPLPLAILGFLILPSLVHGGFGLVLLARGAGLSMPLGKATVISAYAYLAELLPLPGGAIIRAGALVKAGASLRQSSLLVFLTAILWVALAMIGAGLTLLATSLGLASPLMVIGTIAASGVLVWLWSTAGAKIALLTLLHRLFGIAITALRLKFAFAVLGLSVGLLETFPFVLALLLGSATSIAPAGLGVSEALAALAATTGQVPPATAFLAVGIDRLLCLAGCAIMALASQARRTSESASGIGAAAPITGNEI